MARKHPPWLLKLAMRFWPPFLGTGVQVRYIAADFRRIEVEAPLRLYNRNYFGTHFGGTLYAMTDPFFALMVLHNLPDDYLVWDKAGSIEFIAPGRSRLQATFEVTPDDLDHIEKMTAGGDKHLHLFNADIVDREGLVVAKVEKIVYVRRKRRPE